MQILIWTCVNGKINIVTGDPAQMTAELAQQLKEDCLEDLKQRLIDMANLIQGRFEKVY